MQRQHPHPGLDAQSAAVLLLGWIVAILVTLT
jgi:hypothetical protein